MKCVTHSVFQFCLLGSGMRFTSRQWQAESINNFSRKYNFEHKTQFRAGAYQNTLRDFGIFSKYVNGPDVKLQLEIYSTPID